MLEAFTTEWAASWLASRLKDESDTLATRWLDRLVETHVAMGAGYTVSAPNRLQEMAGLIERIAGCLQTVDAGSEFPDGRLLEDAAALGARRLTENATVQQVLWEYDTLFDVLEDFLLGEIAQCEPFAGAQATLGATRQLAQCVRALQRQSVNAFVATCTEAVRRQTEQLATLGRLVGYEMRQPLSVLQVMPAVLPVREGDMELARLLDVFDRNVRRLAKVASRLEQLSHTAR
jgi:hypothetical protein